MTNDELWDDEQIEAANAPKPLRDAYKALKEGTSKRITELEDKLAKAESANRSVTIREAVTEAGLPAKIAKLYPTNAEASPDAVKQWLTENADVFAVGQGGDGEDGGQNLNTPPATTASPEMQQLMGLLREAGVVPPEGAANVVAEIGKATTREELVNLIRTGKVT